MLAAVVLGTTLVLRQRFFAVANDEEYARAVGIPVLRYNLVLAVLTAVTVVVSMRVVGLLLISALMILPERDLAAVRPQLPVRRCGGPCSSGSLCSVGGVLVSYVAETPSGGTIVLLAVAAFIVASVATAAVARARRAGHDRAERHDHEHGPDCGHPAVDHDDHIDYLHDGHRHAAHEGHYDEHGHHDEHGRWGGDAMTEQVQTERRPTRQRAAIAQALAGSREFRSAQDIHADDGRLRHQGRARDGLPQPAGHGDRR